MSRILYTLLFAMQISLIYSQYLQVLPKCNLWDSDCLTRQMQLRIPAITGVSGARALGAEVLDPMRIDYARIDVAGMKMGVSNAVLRGFGSLVIDTARVDPYLKQLHLVFHTPLTMDSQYTSGGTYLGLPFPGDGEFRIKEKNLEIDVVMPFEIVKDAHGRDVMDLRGFQFKTDFKEPVHYDLTNLYHGNKQLGDWVLSFINMYWKTMSETYSTPIMNIAMEKIFKNMRSYLLSEPLNAIFL